MSESQSWQEVESEVYHPKMWLALAVGAFFFLIGILPCFGVRFLVLTGIEFWIALSISAGFALIGGTVCLGVLRTIFSQARVLHAGPDVLPTVPKEPVLLEGFLLDGRLSHELVEDSDHWHFRPAEQRWRKDKGFLLGFGILLMILIAGSLSWVLHSQLNFADWPVSILCATSATVVCMGAPFLLTGLAMRSAVRRLPYLSIPRNGDDLTLDAPVEPDPEKADLITAYWILQGKVGRQRQSISRKLLIAVQLCPWKVVAGKSGGQEITWAVQGLLVLANSDDEAHERLPILLASDFGGAARLMERLASVLEVPHLFCADAEGWKAEENRARTRLPRRFGRFQI